MKKTLGHVNYDWQEKSAPESMRAGAKVFSYAGSTMLALTLAHT